MKFLVLSILITFFPLHLVGEDFVIQSIQGNCLLYKHLARNYFKSKGYGRISILLKDKVALISYQTTYSKSATFYQAKQNNNIYYKSTHKHTVLLHIKKKDNNTISEAYFTLQRKGKEKIKILLTQI